MRSLWSTFARRVAITRSRWGRGSRDGPGVTGPWVTGPGVTGPGVRSCLLPFFVTRRHRGRTLWLDPEDAEAMANWAQGGFSLDASVRIDGADRPGVERLLRYCAPKVLRSCTEEVLLGCARPAFAPRVGAGSCGFLWTSRFPTGARIWLFSLSPSHFSLRPRCPLEAEVHEFLEFTHYKSTAYRWSNQAVDS